ncbi:prepilin-type N-terminal cleavage/methylation domain-containing protein [Phenylobacterium sp.]|uniref:prepilin-type N-terminal cleavage/methylation domain-containing protein n=1 Tax=Phenylobacterium sp. TaxID=1871053 RepID=UPI00286DA354|nr:prepilin-type N-terminal cleavage/methylation domain-containing protein [Phenylobacterium sp.]
MSQAGYTLAETLAALAILGLAVGGLTAGVGLLERGQRLTSQATVQLQAERAAELSLDRMLQGGGPFRSIEPARLTGSATAIVAECGEVAPCRIELTDGETGLGLRITRPGRVDNLPLRRSVPAGFVYRGSSSTSVTWPPDDPRRQVLRSISILRTDVQTDPLLTVRLWREQALDCIFDVVIQDCR